MILKKTMMMMIRRFVISVIFLIFVQSCFSQSDDFGIWYGIDAGFPLVKKLDVDLSAVVRTFDNASKIEQGYLEGGVNYKFNKYLSLAAAYRIINTVENDSRYHLRHRWFADIKGSYPVGKFAFSARFRFQVQTRTFYKNDASEIPDWYARIKLKALYKTQDFPVNPYLFYESWSPLFNKSDRLFDKHRFGVGLEYKFSKIQSVEAEYMFQRDYLPHLEDMNIGSITYNIKF